MQPATIRAFRLIVIAVLFAPDAPANDIKPEQFDLICQGTIARTSFTLNSSNRFTKRLRVDLKRKVFCDDNLCGNLSSTDGVRLEYHCDARNIGYRPCPPEGYGAPQPSIFLDDLVFDRSGASFLRQIGGSTGGVNPDTFTETYLGNCRASAFTGLTYSPDPEK